MAGPGVFFGFVSMAGQFGLFKRTSCGWFGGTHHEYTSAAGGKIFFPLSCSFFRKRFRSRKSFVTISSFNWDSHVSSRDAISSASRSFCSGVSFSTHLPLSNFGSGAAFASAADGAAAGADVKMDAAVVVADTVDFWEESSTSVEGEEGIVEEAVDTAAAAADGLAALEGEEKKEVMVALAFGFLAAEVAMSPALRLRGVAMVRTVCETQLTGGKEVDEVETALYRAL